MNTKKGIVITKGLGDIKASGFENFSSYEVGMRIEPGSYYIAPSQVAFRVDHWAEPDYPPDAHITSEGGENGLSVMLGFDLLDPENRSNSATFDFGMSMTQAVKQVGLTINSRVEGVRYSFEAIVFFLDGSTPSIPVRLFWFQSSVKGDATYLSSLFTVRVNIVNLNVEVVGLQDASEMPSIIKRVWWFQDDEK